jgi:hypothetical protein
VCRHSMPRIAGFALRAFNKIVGIITGSDSGSALESVSQTSADAGAARAKTA